MNNITRPIFGHVSAPIESATMQRRCMEIIERNFHLWGYQPIDVPLLDFADIYEPLLSDSDRRQSYRLVDRNGEILMLCPDMTLFAARHIAAHVVDSTQALRIFYADTILRHRQSDSIGDNEILQVGAELVGCAGVDADLEILTLLCETLERLGLHDCRYHLGSRQLVDCIAKRYGFTSSRPMIAAILVRDWSKLRTLLMDGRDESAAADVERVIGLFSSIIDNSSDLSALLPTAAADERAVLDYLHHCLVSLEQLGWRNICIDLSEVGYHDYYTGIVFQVYTQDAPQPIASGGRYDQLLSHFGNATPSIGFSMQMQTIVGNRPSSIPHQQPSATVAADGSFSNRYRAARVLRDSGKQVTL